MRTLTGFAAIALALGLSATTSMALAEQTSETKPATKPVQMTNDQLDKVTAGALAPIRSPLPPIRIHPIPKPPLPIEPTPIKPIPIPIPIPIPPILIGPPVTAY